MAKLVADLNARDALSALLRHVAVAALLFVSPDIFAETFTIQVRYPQPYSAIRNVLVRQSDNGKNGGFAEGGINMSNPGASGGGIYIGNLEMAKAVYGFAGSVITPGLYGIYKPSGDLVLASRNADWPGGTIILSSGAAQVRLASNTILGRLCKWVPYDDKKGLDCATPDEHWTVMGMGTGDETGAGSYIRFSSGTYSSMVLCCRFATDVNINVTAAPPCQVPADDFRTIMCPDGGMGGITESRSYTCPGPVAGPWGQMYNTCPAPCKPYSETRKIPCPDVTVPANCAPFAPGTGCMQLSGTAWLCGTTYVTCSAAVAQPQVGAITQTKTWVCPGPVSGGWVNTSSTCRKPCALPPDNTANKDCPMGQSGTITMTQHFTCELCGAGGATCPTPGPWVETANTCYTPCAGQGGWCTKHSDCCGGCCNINASMTGGPLNQCGDVRECYACAVVHCTR